MSSRFKRVRGGDRAFDGEAAADSVGPTAPRADEPRFAPSPKADATGPLAGASGPELSVDLTRRRDELTRRFAELQYDLGGIFYEMAIRDHIRIEVLVRHAATLQDVDAELHEVERIAHLEETGNAGACASCGVPHSSGAVYCWQCGQPLLEHVSSRAIGA
jgi:hypothetical protein